jgi:cytochrome c-type biogenesis protein CcmF
MFIPGVIALWVAFAALCASTTYYVLSLRGNEGARTQARQFFALMTFAVLAASGMLLYLILTHDFRIHYVFSYSDRSLPFGYLFSTFWAGQEGSFLLWLLAGALIGLPLIRYARHYEDRTLIVYNLTLASLLLILMKQSPFRFLDGLPPGQVPFDGQGLNPLLQNPWMTIHPPIMFFGYAATAVPFAFAVAALWGRRYDEWVKASLPWALFTVVTLGCAILLGGYWAYVTLGWGGYWGWDPVENSSLVPWLSSAALVHGMLLQRARGRFRKLNFALAVLSFVLVVYATFLTRSGVLADFSVHSFVDLGITGWLVANLAVFFVLGFAALVWRWREIPAQAGDEPFLSRTVFFVLAISTLLGTAGMVLLGTSAPLITRLASEPSQVSPAFYNRVTLPVGILFATLLGVVPYLHWRGAHDVFRKRIATSLGAAVLLTAAGLAFGARGTLYTAFLFVSLFAFVSNLVKTVEEVRNARLRVAGGYLAHVGLGLMLAGIITSSAFDRSEKIVLPLGESRQVLGYTLTFRGVDKPTPTARDAMLVEVRDGSGRAYTARPKMFRNEKSNQLVANPDVRMRLTHDVYIAPIEFDPGRTAETGTVIELGKGETGTVGPFSITFTGFDMGGAHGEGDTMSVAAVLSVVAGGAPQQLRPTLSSGPQGLQPQAVALPGNGGATVSVAGLNANAGRVRLEVSGVSSGIAKRVSVRQGEALTYRGVTLTFDEFDLSDFDPQEGRINLGAVLKVGSGQTGDGGGEITAHYRSDGTSEKHVDAVVPGLDGVKVRVGRMDPNEKSVELLVLDAGAPPDPGEPARFAADFTVKPMIGLLWIGLVILLVGGVVAVARRSEEFAAPAAATAAAGK